MICACGWRRPKLDRVKDLPWLTMLQGAAVVGRRWSSLSEKERAQLIRILRDSRGRKGNLSVKQRYELRRLARKLDLKGAGTRTSMLHSRRAPAPEAALMAGGAGGPSKGWSESQAEAHLRSLELFGMRFGLDRMRRMMTVLGSPSGASRRSTCSARTARPRPRG